MQPVGFPQRRRAPDASSASASYEGDAAVSRWLAACSGNFAEARTNAVENCCLGMGDHVAATAADASANIPRWVVMTPALKHMIAQAHLVSDALAGDLDPSHTLAVPAQTDAVATLTNLIASLRKAEPNAITVSLKLGW